MWSGSLDSCKSWQNWPLPFGYCMDLWRRSLVDGIDCSIRVLKTWKIDVFSLLSSESVSYSCKEQKVTKERVQFVPLWFNSAEARGWTGHVVINGRWSWLLVFVWTRHEPTSLSCVWRCLVVAASFVVFVDIWTRPLWRNVTKHPVSGSWMLLSPSGPNIKRTRLSFNLAVISFL